MGNLMSRLTARPGALIALMVLLFLSVTILGDRFLRGVSLDLTEDGLYTLSDGTIETIAALGEPVTFDLYFSRALATPYPQLLSFGKRIEDLVATLASRSGGKIILNVIEPEPFSEDEDRAVEAGLKGVPLSDGSTLYLGLAARNAVDGEASIPFFSQEREQFLEYDLVKLIGSLSDAGKKRLTLLTALPMQFGPGGPQAMMSGQAQPYVLYEQLREFYDVQEIAEDFTEIPAETDVLMIVQPPALNDDQLFAIDQFVLKGGRALVFLDPHSEAMNPRAMEPSPSALGVLLKAWGVEMPEGKVLGDAALAQRVQMGGYGPDSVKDYVFWLNIGKSNLNADDVVTGTVNTLNLASTGVLEPVEGATTTVTPLITSSSASMLFDASRAVGMPDPDGLMRDLVSDGKNHIIGARLSGPAKSAFPDRVKVDAPTVDAGGVAEGSINLVLVADSDLFDDRFWVQVQNFMGERMAVPVAGNGSFVLNLADHIAGSEALLDLRARGIARRPFVKVEEMRREADAHYRSEEQALEEKLQSAEQRLAELEGQVPEGQTVFSPEQEAEIERFRTELVETRKALREVKRELRAEIEGLGHRLAFINIALIPILLVLAALGRAYVRRRRTAG
ncbi:Gldg family protein [Gimibacter soli]|uniref:Gldg family protein n=1 Tax=Gimibacter soli TaxID=3024400 RepID=A0AAE9XUM4_9PROT|nr:Gldg family protein [Gimibacter soli]WCL54875.1 Gldg family protein [Gimibacter soli]